MSRSPPLRADSKGLSSPPPPADSKVLPSPSPPADSKDPHQGEFPNIIEEYLSHDHGAVKCIAFNRTGTLLAAGCSNGRCVIWDFETKGLAREFRDKDYTAPITSVSWSKYGHRLLASATDKSLTLWDVSSGEKIARIILQKTPMCASLQPAGTPTPSICLVCPLSSSPLLVDLDTGSTTVLPVSVSENGNGNPPAPNFHNKFADGTPPFTPTAATFDKHGDLIYVGNSMGEILVIDSKSIQVHAVIPIPGGAVVKDIVLSRDGRYLLTNSTDRVIRVYKNILPVKGSGEEIRNISNNNNENENRYDKLIVNGARCLILSCELSDSTRRTQWKTPCFSGNGQSIGGASAKIGEHRLQIWDQAGLLVKILDGPKESVLALAWHPAEPTIATVSAEGIVYVWAKEHIEDWSAFAPNFKELEENEEYEEREDEFDLNPRSDEDEEVEIDEDADIDIETCEETAMFSDVEDSVDEIIYLPAIPSPDVPDEQQEKCLGSSSKSLAPSPMEEVNNSTAEDPAEGPNSERKRKCLESQLFDVVKTPATKNHSSGKSTNSGAKQIEPAHGNCSTSDDESTEGDEIKIDG